MKTIIPLNALTTLAHLKDFLAAVQPKGYPLAGRHRRTARDAIPSGPATKKLCERAGGRLFGEAESQRLATISISQMHNLRKSTGHLRNRQSIEKIRPTRSHIGERRQPHPAGQTGFLPIITVPQEDWDKRKWVFPINAIDHVTQFQVVCTLEKISEAYLLKTFPFIFIQELHSDNGSEYINRLVVLLLRKLLIDFTNPAPARPTIRLSLKGRMWRLHEHSLAIATFHNAGARAHQCLQSEAPHALSELSTALLLSGDPDGSEGQSTQDLSLRKDDDPLCQAGITPAGGIG